LFILINQVVLSKGKKNRTTIIFLLVEQFVKNSEFGIWKFVKTCNEQLKCYEEKKCIAVISIINE